MLIKKCAKIAFTRGVIDPFSGSCIEDEAQLFLWQKTRRSCVLAVVAASLSLLGFVTPAFGIASTENWERELPDVPQEHEMHEAGPTGWWIPVGPTGIRAIITAENPACFTVKYVFKNSPAYGKVKAGDLICGANGTKLKKPHHFAKKIEGGRGMEGPLTEMAPLIEASQGSDGKLDLMVHPGGDTKVTNKVTIQIDPVGRFSPTYPYNCPRSDKLVKDLCEIITKEFERTSRHRTHVYHHMLLALMASGDKKYESMIKEYAHRNIDKKIDVKAGGFQSWGSGFEGVFLGEYYVKTKDSKVLPRLKELNTYYRDGIGLDRGCYSHVSRPSIIMRVAEGKGYGYGSMSAPGGLAMLAMSLCKLGGVPYDEFTYERIHQAYLRGTTEESIGAGYGFADVPSVHVELKNPKQGLSGRGPGFRCPTGMKDITEYKIIGVSFFNDDGTDPKKKWAQKMWSDLDWVEKERDRNLVVEWTGAERHIIRDPVVPEPTRPYKTTKGNSQAAAGMGALSHIIGNDDRKSWQYLGVHAGNSAALSPEGWFQGHCSAGIHQLWQALGASRADKDKFREFMDGVKWWFVMMQTHDGSYMSCPNRDRAQTDPGYGPYTMPTANAALILALPRHQLQITGADSPSGGYASSSSSDETPIAKHSSVVVPVKVSREPRSLSDDRLEILDGALLKTLVGLSSEGQIKPVPLNLSITRAKIWLTSAGSDGELTLQVVGGAKTAKMKWGEVQLEDRATLALLVAHLKPDSTDAQAMAGVYMESLGKVDQAEHYYEEAGEASRKKLEKLFE